MKRASVFTMLHCRYAHRFLLVTESSEDLTIFEELRFSASDELGCLGGPHNQINKTSFTEMGNACTPVCIKTKSSKVTNVESEQDPAIGRGSVCLVKTNTRIFANYDIGNVLGMEEVDSNRDGKSHLMNSTP